MVPAAEAPSEMGQATNYLSSASQVWGCYYFNVSQFNTLFYIYSPYDFCSSKKNPNTMHNWKTKFNSNQL